MFSLFNKSCKKQLHILKEFRQLHHVTAQSLQPRGGQLAQPQVLFLLSLLESDLFQNRVLAGTMGAFQTLQTIVTG